ncbi:MAG: DUF3800 domain-containing protein [Clostridiales Family XIII bacterium]|jgi:hypothetical protein|nr:DUF3800 domain-containing protein [Clostridiales Family XIII bacterium]
MKIYYLDESGDLGFDFRKLRTSRFFVIAFLIADDKRPVHAVIKKALKGLPENDLKHNHGVLHAGYEKSSTCIKLLRHITSKDICIAVMKLDKRKLTLPENIHDFYSQVVISLFNCLHTNGLIDSSEQICLIASQRETNKQLNDKFAAMVSQGTSIVANISTEIAKPYSDKGLQVVDFIAWAYWQKYENDNPLYADILSAKTILECSYDGDKKDRPLIS